MRLLSSTLLIPLAAARTLQLHHRVVPNSGSSTPEWSPLGTIEFTDTSDMVHVSTTPEASRLSLSGASIDGTSSGDDREKDWYQVGWQNEDEEWIYGSTRACYLTSPLQVDLFLHDTHPTSLSIRSYAPPSGSCPPKPPSASFISSAKVLIKRASTVLGPRPAGPAAPQPTNVQTGMPEAPPPEKSFLQKYWMPMLGIGVFIVGQMTNPPAQQGAGAGGAGGAGGGGGGGSSR